MTSTELQEQLTDVENRLREASQRAAIASLSVDDKLEAQRHLDQLQSLQRRLQTQLAGARQQEETTQKELEEFARETELETIRSTYADNAVKTAQLVNQATKDLIELVEPLNKLIDEHYALRTRYDTAFNKRFGRSVEYGDRLQAQNVEHAPFSDIVSTALYQIAEGIAHQKQVEKLRNGG